MKNNMILVVSELDEKQLARQKFGLFPSTVRTMWDAFECCSTDPPTMVERVEEEIILPDGLVASVDNLIAIAAMLGSLLSTEGRVIIGIYHYDSVSYIDVDSSELCDTDDVYTYIAELRKTTELVQPNVCADIEVTDGQTSPPLGSLVWLVAKGDRCVLSVRKDRIDQAAREHLRKITLFACARVLNPIAIPMPDTLPTHPVHESNKRNSLIENVLFHVKMRPLALAIVDDNDSKTLTYSELWNASNMLIQQVCDQIFPQCLQPRLALFLERSWQHLASIIATQRMGGTCVLIDPANPDDLIRNFLQECSPDSILTTSSMLDRVRNLTSCPILEIGKEDIQLLQVDWKYENWVESTNEAGFIAGTSGTTGRPKAVCLSYRGMAATLDTITNYAELGESSRGSWLTSPGYGMVEVDPLPVLYAGGTVCIPSSEVLQDVRLLALWFVKNNITHTLAMTSLAEAFWAGGWQTELRTMLIAGERCKRWPPPNLSYQVLNVYGSAEAAVVSIENLSSPQHYKMLPSVGQVVAGANMYVVDSVGQELPANCIGELVITGDTLSVGYINIEDTKKSFHPNMFDNTSSLQYLTGDRARMSLDGTVEIFGRLDSIVKIRGHRVDLTEVEISALEVDDVAKAATICFTNDMGTTLVLFIEQIPEAKGKVDVVDTIRKHLSKRVKPAAQPNQIVVDVLPVGRNGKVDYRALKVPPIELDMTHTIFSPSTEIENVLRFCWLNWTGCDEATLESNFFNSGGDSLRAMRMVGELACKHGIHIEMSPFLENPLLSNLVRLGNSSRDTNLPTFEHLSADKQLQPFALNESQQALWIGRGSDFDYGSVGCQGYFEWEVEYLEQERFVRAVSLLIDRHPMLQITISEDGYQQIGVVDGSKAVEYVDLSDLPDSGINDKINIARRRMADDEIGTTQWPLFRFVVSKISPRLSRVHFCIDMLIADAWSIFQVIIPDLIDLYIEENPQLPKLKTSFFDYVAHRHKVIQSAQYRADREFWLQKIVDLPPAPRLPQFEIGESIVSPRFERHESTLEQASWDRLKAQAKERNISPSGIVALALCEVLRCWSEEDRFTLNFPVSDRMPVSDDIDLVVGDFTNTLLVPYETTIDDTLEERGQKLQNAIWSALDHRLFTGVEVLRELSRIRRNGRAPLMPVVLTSLLGHPGRHDVARLGREVFGVSQTPQVTLDVQVRESDRVLYFKWDYLTGVIRPDVIEAMFGAFCRLLQQLACDSDIWKRTWLDLRPASQIVTRNTVNSTQEPVPEVHLRDLFLNCLSNRANEPAVIDVHGTYTWEEIGNAAAQLSVLIKTICSPSDRFVGIVLPKGLMQYVAVYGCLLAGVGYVPVDIDLPAERIETMLAQAGVRAVISSPEAILPSGIQRVECTATDLNIWIQQKTEIMIESIRENYAPYVIFTSGSTGNPKGVEIPEAAVVNHVFDVVERFSLDGATRHLATAALHFDMSVFDIFGPLVHGGSVVIPEQAAGPDPDAWLQLHRRHKVSFWACVPAVMELICSVAEVARTTYIIESVVNIVMAGDWIPLSLLPRARAVFPSARMFSCGGPTETTNWSVIHEINEFEGSIVRSVIYGTPMRNSAYHIVADDWIDCPDWVPGEILVESDIALARGYIGQPELTQRAFVYHPRTGGRMYRTGDLGRYLPNGEIEILGRIDNQIKINGLRIELGEIENVAQSCDGVSRACAVALPGLDGHPKQIALAYIGEPNHEAIISEIITRYLPAYMIPKTIKHMLELPLSKNGKVDVMVLRNVLRGDMKAPIIRNQQTILREVIRVISAQLAEPVVLPEDNFFDLGGNSLTAMKIKIELESQFEISIPLESIMLTESIRECAEKLAERSLR
ncbi:putative non-ribosomal peptide synthase [Xenorhabdus vietnamensis]|uniref:Putative non-ribosomal peptide synthase n=1 Tax=Xenorhabdus vietnamensis TaxID=351656 RepID=A0A1Y2SA34_9GAMM|nr:non-ribosomal peptide synthetase [Xenorhabdus vietnamensis]OTA14361.1 putative non-ribosomal peptide synthase [Xenorhabdus vietnamensis]UVN17718.1 Phenyloxazoline synthase MbtB [Xenorhabdus vietnamensis]